MARRRGADRDRRAIDGGVDLAGIAETLDPQSGAALLEALPLLATRTTTSPDAWILTTTAVAARGGPPFALELRLVRAGTRAAVVRRRTWP